MLFGHVAVDPGPPLARGARQADDAAVLVAGHRAVRRNEGPRGVL